MASRVRISGGQKFYRYLSHAGVGGVSVIRVGFWQTDKYPGRGDFSTADAAAINELGRGVPERPFMRQTLEMTRSQVNRDLYASFDAAKIRWVITQATAERVGKFVQRSMRKRITDFDDPRNAESTERRKGRNDPLVDSGFMRARVRFKIDKSLAQAQVSPAEFQAIAPAKKRTSTKNTLRGRLYAVGKLLGDVGAVGGPKFSKVRGRIYGLARGLGDVQSVREGSVADRIVSRASGRLASRGAQSTQRAEQGSLSARVQRRATGRFSGQQLRRVPRTSRGRRRGRR